MRKIVTLLVTLFVLGATGAFAQCASFYDGFESGNYTPNWGNVGGSYTRTMLTTGVPVGNYALQQAGGTGHYSGLLATFTPSTPNYISYWANSSNAGTSDTYFVIGDNSTNGNNGIAFIYFWGSGSIRFITNSSATYVNVPYTANTWYHIELRNVDWNAKTYDIWVNNVQYSTGSPFRAQASTFVDRIYLYNFNSATAQYDDVIVGGQPLALSPAVVDVSCNGDSSGSIAPNLTGATGPVSYQWSNGDTTPSLNGVPAGMYTLQISDSAGCVLDDTFTVGEPTALAVGLTGVDPLCNGDSSGTIDLSASGGTPSGMGYNYLWSTGDTIEDLSSLAAGSYTVTVSDSLGCTRSDSFSVSQPPVLSAQASGTDISCAGQTDGQATVMGIGGTPGYTYSWSNGDTSAMITGLLAGAYSVTVTDSNGCVSAGSAQIAEPLPVQVSGTVTNETGSSDGAITTAVVGGTPGYTYSWNTGDTTPDLMNIGAGTYILTVVDSNGCSVMDTFEVLLVVGRPDPFSDAQISLYPNPTQGQVNILAEGLKGQEISLEIYDAQGRLVQQYTGDVIQGSYSRQIDLSDESKGVYLIRLRGENGVNLSRVIKK